MLNAAWFCGVTSVGTFKSVLTPPGLVADCAACDMVSRGKPQIHSCAAAAVALLDTLAAVEPAAKACKPCSDVHCCSCSVDRSAGLLCPFTVAVRSTADNKTHIIPEECFVRRLGDMRSWCTVVVRSVMFKGQHGKLASV